MTQHFNFKVFKLHPKISLGDQDNHHLDKTISVPFEHMRLCYFASLLLMCHICLKSFTES